MLLSAAAGIASFFSPCSFPLAVILVARETSPGQQGRVTRLALWLGLGALLFLVLAGALIAVGAGAFFKQVTFTSAAGITIRAVVGSLLILLGLIQLNVLPVSLLAVEEAAKPFLARQARLRRERPALAFGLFGFGYLLAGFG
jgi:cytochrome c biogenesis protein CcdA